MKTVKTVKPGADENSEFWHLSEICFVSQPSSPSRAIRHYSKAFTDRHTFGAAFSEEMSIEKKKS